MHERATSRNTIITDNQWRKDTNLKAQKAKKTSKEAVYATN